VNECKTFPGLCTHGTCHNSMSSFHCSCDKGFTLDAQERNCTDIDECRISPDICGQGTCINTPGSFECDCFPGFTSGSLLMKNCMDVDECASDPLLCQEGTCINTEGSYECHCPPGRELKSQGTACEDVRLGLCFLHWDSDDCGIPLPGKYQVDVCCCSIGSSWGAECKLCPEPGSSEFSSLCPQGLGFASHGFLSGHPFYKDVDECAVGNLCMFGNCENLPGTFRCSCDDGYELDQSGSNCTDVNECENPANCINGLCVNTPGSYLCSCPQDFQLNPSGVGCVAEYRTLCPGGKGFRPNPSTVILEDINECQELRGLCRGGICTNTFGTFQCECPVGYSLSEDTRTCEDVGKCANGKGLCQRNPDCINVPGSYRCKCARGFELSLSWTCVDIDECTILVGQVCQFGQCLNTAGSFHCLCQDGFELTAGRKDCMDINECLSLPGTCLPGTCQNLEGSFQCICPPGFRVQSGHCIDIDECLQDPSLCFFGTCTNSPGTFQCLCPSGFVLSDNEHYCVDTRQSFCFTQFEAGKCSTPKAFNTTKTQCCCSKNPAEGWGDPCQLCPQKDSVTFEELCPFSHGAIPGPDDSRKDMNECAENPGICTEGLCVNADGSFHCKCPFGYSLDFASFTCIDTNECSIGEPCGEGICTNVIGSFKCTGTDGFELGPMLTCEDIDECTLNPLLCAFRCHNTEGSYLCTCPAGYTLRKDGAMCQDVDECADGSQDCHIRGMLCKNLIGTYACICPPGMQPQPSGEECTDEDECQLQSSLCAHGHCVNTVGSFQCNCDEGFHPSPALTECNDIRRGLCFSEVLQATCQNRSSSGEAVPKVMCCCGGGRGWGPHCELCPLPGTSAYRELCPHGKGYSTEGQDVDECHMFADLCHHGECINSIGSFHCDCQAGYTPDATATACMDVDECSQDPKPCSFLCKNTEGTFLCACPRGYLLEEDLRTCKDLDECTSRQHNCQFLCVNTIGTFTCRCPPGFTQHHQACFDVNECDRPHHCQFGCQNELGGYRCNCPQGFTQHSQWAQCVDENECALSPTPCGSASCYNTLGSFRCVCPSGFSFNQDLGGCQDVDECAEQGSPCSYGCANTPGGFLCGCPQGYFRAGQGHCISSPGINSGSQATPDEEESLSPEACYECKINGLSPQDRPRRSASGGHQVSLATLDAEVPLTLRLHISHLSQVKHILEFRPALGSLERQMRYIIARGNNRGFFRMSHLDGFSSLQLGRRRPRPGKYQLEVVSIAGSQGQLEPATRALRLTVQLQLL
ncbi:fibrillin-2-like protein, partial [Cricetulus griseus]